MRGLDSSLGGSMRLGLRDADFWSRCLSGMLSVLVRRAACPLVSRSGCGTLNAFKSYYIYHAAASVRYGKKVTRELLTIIESEQESQHPQHAQRSEQLRQVVTDACSHITDASALTDSKLPSCLYHRTSTIPAGSTRLCTRQPRFGYLACHVTDTVMSICSLDRRRTI